MTVLRAALGVVACIAVPAVAATAATLAVIDAVTRRSERDHDRRVAEVGDEAESWLRFLYEGNRA